MNRKIINTILSVIFFILVFFISFIFYKQLFLLNNKNIILVKDKNIKNKIIQEKHKNSKVKLYIWGDIMLSRTVWYFNKKKWYKRILEKYNPVSITWWLVFFNLESPFSKKPKDNYSNSFYFWSGTWNIEILKQLKWNNKMIVSLANNHIRNSLKEWIETTISLLNKNNILFNWISTKKHKNNIITKLKLNNLLICLQAFSYDWWDYWYVKVNKISKKNIKKSLDLMKKQNCDLNLISLHWWTEYKYKPSKKQVKLAHYIIDNGADIIIWHHPHIFWKTEIYKQKPIFYSLGNFIFDQDLIVNNCNKYRSCIYDEKLKKKILPVNIWISYELEFEKHKFISKIQKKHRLINFWELTKY